MYRPPVAWEPLSAVFSMASSAKASLRAALGLPLVQHGLGGLLPRRHTAPSVGLLPAPIRM